MKNCIVILLFLFASKIFATCGCYIVNVTEYYNRADIVLEAKVKKVYLNSSPDVDYYRIDIETINVFKGNKISTLMVWGSSDGTPRTSCDMFTPEKSVYLMYLEKSPNGEYHLSMCSGSKRIDKKFSSNWPPRAKENLKRSRALEFEVISFLKDKKLDLSYQKTFHPEELIKYIDQKRGVEISNKFAFYQITLKPDLSLKEIKPLQEFDNKIVSNEIYNCLKSIKNWNISNEENSIEDITFLIELYYYPAEEESKSLISIYTI